MSSDTFKLRNMALQDLPAVHAIEIATQIDPWSMTILEGCLRVGYHNRVIFYEQNQMLGFSIANYVVDVCHLMNLAISPQWQNQGLGKQLLEDVLQEAQGAGCQACFLEVRISNTKAISIYEKQGFEVIRRRENYYRQPSGREDALEMRFVF